MNGTKKKHDKENVYTSCVSYGQPYTGNKLCICVALNTFLRIIQQRVTQTNNSIRQNSQSVYYKSCVTK